MVRWWMVAVALAMAGVSMGAAVAVDAPPGAPVFQTAHAHVGDAWTYEVAVDGHAVNRTFHWENGAMRQADGNRVEAPLLVETMLDMVPCASGRPIERRALSDGMAWESHEDVALERTWCHVQGVEAGGLGRNDMQAFWHENTTERAGAGWAPCGFRSALEQGIPVDTPFPALGCAGLLRATAWSSEALQAEALDGTRITWHAAHPVPLRIERLPSDETWTLVGFQAGDEPWDDGRIRDHWGVARMERDAVHRLGSTDPADYPLVAALEAVHADTDLGPQASRAWLAGASFRSVSDHEGEERHVWRLSFVDGAGAWGANVSVPAASSDGVLRTLRELADVESAAPFVAAGDEGRLPGRMADPASLARYWESAEGWTPQAWGFHACWSCAQPTWHTWVGLAESARDHMAQVHGEGGLLRHRGETAWETERIRSVTADSDGAFVSSQGLVPWQYIWSYTGRVGGKDYSYPAPEDLPAVQSSVPSDLAPWAWTAGGAALLAAATLVVARLWPGLFLFSREVNTDHPTRKRILAIVRAEPGIHQAAIRRVLECGNHVASHHLRRLVGDGRLVRRRGARYTCYFLPGAVDRGAMEAAGLLRAPRAKQLVAHVRRHPGCNGRDLADALGVAPGTVAFHARRLVQHGVLRAQRDGRSVRYRLAEPRMGNEIMA